MGPGSNTVIPGACAGRGDQGCQDAGCKVWPYFDPIFQSHVPTYRAGAPPSNGTPANSTNNSRGSMRTYGTSDLRDGLGSGDSPGRFTLTMEPNTPYPMLEMLVVVIMISARSSWPGVMVTERLLAINYGHR